MDFHKHIEWEESLKRLRKKAKKAEAIAKNPVKKQEQLLKNEHHANKLKQSQIDQDSPNERRFRHLLIEHGIKHVYQQPFFCHERFVCVDFYFPEKNLVIEIDGKEHNKDWVIVKDALRDEYIKTVHNVKSIWRITNKQLANDIDNVKEFVLSKLMDEHI